jgi:hypothetical protein
MIARLCHACGRPTLTEDCDGCGEKTLAIGASPPIVWDADLRAICAIFRDGGVVNEAERLERLSNIAGRPISRYDAMTVVERRRAKAALRAWEKGRGNGGRLAAVRTPEGDEAA